MEHKLFMKRLATYSLSFGKVLGLVSLFAFLLLPMQVSAATFSCVSKPVVKKDGSFLYRVEVKVKGDGVTKIDLRLKESPNLTGNTGFPSNTAPSTSGTNFTFSINSTSYAQNAALDLYAHKSTGELIEKVSGCSFVWKVNSTAPIVTTPPAPQGTVLPVEFVKSSTVLGSNAITLTVRNKSTKSFDIEVLAGSVATNSVVETKKTTVAGGADAQLFFNQGVKNGETYNLSMYGKEVGSSTTYQAVKYDGLKLTGTTSTPTDPGTPNPNPAPTKTPSPKGDGTCKDGIDNSSPADGKADYYGVDSNNDGSLDLEPDPSCISPEDTEKSDLAAGNLLSCYNYCTFSDVLKTINNIITFLITKLFIPILVLLFMFAGVKYILAQGNPSKVANLKKMVINIVIGLLLVLCSWLIVKVILRILVKDSDSALQFLE